ncbi:MAG TPA: TolC family protein [Thermoanaerobaculia bacterium]|nr:TolC family protein [Thermoanaerobaculia bacterium]
MRRAPVALLLVAAAGCTAVPEKTVKDAVSAAPAQPWAPPAKAAMPAPPAAKTAPVIPEEYLKPGTTLSLAQLVDVGLHANPLTRAAWASARAAAAEVGSKRSLYFPTFEVDGELLRQKTPFANGPGFANILDTTYGPSVAATWLLFDSGGREADVEQATRALYAANWTHNAAIQDVVLAIAQAYYQYLNAKALVIARQASLDEARRSLDAAEERHRAGVATIADVLQARTSVSQAELDLQDTQGQVQIIRGALATAVGVPANLPVDVGDLPSELPLDMVRKGVDELIAKAAAERPDLAASRFTALAAQSKIRSVQAEGLPKLSTAGTLGKTFLWAPGPDPVSSNYSALLLLRIPIFTGFDVAYRTQKAKEEADAASATAERVEDQVILDVWASYYAMKTATQRVQTTRDLLASATQSADVADGRYKAGVGSILDLLTTQASLAAARAEEVQARSLWFLAMAELAHATGALVPRAAEITGATMTKTEIP